MIDLHTHILPGVDDGATDMDEALAMLRIAQDGGIERIVATPHHDGLDEARRALIAERLGELRSAATEAGLTIEVLGGFELALTPQLIQRGDALGSLGLNGSRYLLVELPQGIWPPWVADVLFQLQGRGLRPILAHVERYPAIVSDLSLAEDLARRGIVLQVNADSLLGERGGTAARCATRLLTRGLVRILASDAHSPRTRRPNLPAAAAAAGRQFGDDVAMALVGSNPGAILDDGDIPTMPDRHQGTGLLAKLGQLLRSRA